MMAITCAKIALRMRFRFVVEPVGVQACDGVYLDWMMVFTSAKQGWGASKYFSGSGSGS